MTSTLFLTHFSSIFSLLSDLRSEQGGIEEVAQNPERKRKAKRKVELCQKELLDSIKVNHGQKPFHYDKIFLAELYDKCDTQTERRALERILAPNPNAAAISKFLHGKRSGKTYRIVRGLSGRVHPIKHLLIELNGLSTDLRKIEFVMRAALLDTLAKRRNYTLKTLTSDYADIAEGPCSLSTVRRMLKGERHLHPQEARDLAQVLEIDSGLLFAETIASDSA